MYNRQQKCHFVFGMVGNGGKWWENGGKMVGISTQTYEDTFERFMDHVSVNRHGGLYYRTFTCIN